MKNDSPAFVFEVLYPQDYERFMCENEKKIRDLLEGKSPGDCISELHCSLGKIHRGIINKSLLEILKAYESAQSILEVYYEKTNKAPDIQPNNPIGGFFDEEFSQVKERMVGVTREFLEKFEKDKTLKGSDILAATYMVDIKKLQSTLLEISVKATLIEIAQSLQNTKNN